MNAAFFVISLNQTKTNQVAEHHNPHSEYQDKPMRILNIANSSQTTAVISDIPSFTEFVAIVYLVDTNNNIYKSTTLLIETEESGKLLHFLWICVRRVLLSVIHSSFYSFVLGSFCHFYRYNFWLQLLHATTVAKKKAPDKNSNELRQLFYLN